jgi:enoyl-CoA hydratase
LTGAARKCLNPQVTEDNEPGGFETLLYSTRDRVATITLNRPAELNTIIPPMPDEVEAAVAAAIRDSDVSVIVVRGAARSFSAGYDFGGGFHHWDQDITTAGRWDPGKDFVFATPPSIAPTQKFMSVWRSPKPVIVQVHGYCLGGGSDFALAADLVIASDDAVIGTPYSRMWGCYLSGDVALPPGAYQGQGVRADRQGTVGPGGRADRAD